MYTNISHIYPLTHKFNWKSVSKFLGKNVHSTFIHHSQKSGNNQNAHQQDVVKQVAVPCLHEIRFINKEK